MAQRLVREAERPFKQSLPNWLQSWLRDDPSGKATIHEGFHPEYLRLKSELTEDWRRLEKGFFERMEEEKRLELLKWKAECEAQRMEWMAATERMLKLKRKSRLVLWDRAKHVVGMTLILSLSILAMWIAVPKGISQIWQPPLMTQLEAENTRLQRQIRVLAAQPQMREQVILIPSKDEIWAEVAEGVMPISTTVWEGKPMKQRPATLILLKTRLSKN